MFLFIALSADIEDAEFMSPGLKLAQEAAGLQLNTHRQVRIQRFYLHQVRIQQFYLLHQDILHLLHQDIRGEF